MSKLMVMAVPSAKRTVWMIPIAAIVVWELLNLVLDFVPYLGNTKLFLAPVLFFLEFAILPILSLWLGAHAVKKNGLPITDALKEFAIFFAAFLITALLVTLATTSGMNRLDRLAVSMGMFAFLAVIKLALCLVAFLVGTYLPAGSSWDGFRLFGVVFSAIALAAALAIGAVLGQYLATSSDFQQSPGFSYSLEKCTPGEWAYIKILGMDLNITTVGTATYRAREACHSAGNTSYLGNEIKVDLYSIDANSSCHVTTSTDSHGATEVKEKCTGDWPGYAGAGN